MHGVLGCVHEPVPLHMPAAIVDFPSTPQPAGIPQTSPACVWHALPSVAQRAFAPHAVSVAQAAAQQTLLTPLLTQLPLMQSPGALQDAPSASSGGLHLPAMQTRPVAHAAGFPVQSVAQALPTQTNPV